MRNHIFSSPFHLDPIKMAFNCGTQNDALQEFLLVVRLCPDEYLQMMREAIERASIEDNKKVQSGVDYEREQGNEEEAIKLGLRVAKDEEDDEEVETDEEEEENEEKFIEEDEFKIGNEISADQVINEEGLMEVRKTKERLEQQARERRERLKTNKKQEMTKEEFNEKWTLPAYLRRGVKVDNEVPHSSEPFISRYNLNDDNNLLGNNKFLHDNVD